MIETDYFANIDRYPSTSWRMCVARKYPWFIKKGKLLHLEELAPSHELLDDWKQEKITWEEYESRYRDEVDNSSLARKALAWLGIKHCEGAEVVLFCWEKEPPCHRFILRDMIVGDEK